MADSAPPVYQDDYPPLYQATISGGPEVIELPLNFSYKPPTPIKRTSTVQTVGATVTREAPVLVPSDILVSWNIEHGCKQDYDKLRTLYEVLPSPVCTFTGYWGDVFTFRFFALDPPTVRARVWSISGSFRVEELTTYANDDTR